MRKPMFLIKGKKRDPYAEHLVNGNYGIFYLPARGTEVAIVDPRKSELTSNLSINTHSQDHYQILGVLPSANAHGIKVAYKQLVLKFHPDKNPSPEAVAKFLEITAAFEVLGDSKKRLQYDLQKHRPWSASSGTKAICLKSSNNNVNESDQLLNAGKLLALMTCLTFLSTATNTLIFDTSSSYTYPSHLLDYSNFFADCPMSNGNSTTSFILKYIAELNEFVNRVTQPYIFPQGCFFTSAQQRTTPNIKRGLGCADGTRLVQKLLAAGVNIEKVKFYNDLGINREGPFNGLLIPKSDITDLSSFQQSLKGISDCGRTFPVVVEGDWLKIDCVSFVPSDLEYEL